MSTNNQQLTTDNSIKIGSWITLNHMGIAEVMATAGFSWLCLDLEHSVIDYYGMQVMISTIQSKGVKAYVRVGGNDAMQLKRVCDAGVDGIICPMINTKEEAMQLVSNIKYPPKGTRGVGLARAQNYGLDEGFEKYKTKHIDVIAQIEHYKAIENIEDIMNVEGIDGTFIGPYDLSGSMGKPGLYEEEDVKEQIVRYEQKAKASGKLMGFHVIQPKHELVKEKINKGYNFIAFSIDTLFLGVNCREQMKSLL
jgi:2-keto-3-deoxy-L-rhamnonate aldolase RhmA